MQIRNKNKKGFTLTEIIASLVILGVILLIAVPSVGKLQKKFRDEYYKQLNETVITAAKTYFKDNPQERPNLTEKVGARAITSTKLIEDKYLDKIDSYNNGICKSYTVILKNGNDYSYQNCMKCKDNYGEFDNTDQSYCSIFDDKYNLDIDNNEKLASKIEEKNATYNTDSKDQYFYVYDEKDIKDGLCIAETASIGSFTISTNDKICPQNITGIDLRKEKSEKVNGIVKFIPVSVKYNYEDGYIEKNVYIYKYPAPKYQISNTTVTLIPNEFYFGEIKYTTAERFAPLGAADIDDYQYNSSVNNKWVDLNCSLNASSNFKCTKNLGINTGSIKFRIKSKKDNNYYYSYETDPIYLQNSYGITLDANGGMFSDGNTTKSHTVTYNGTYGVMEEPTRDYYTFIGWWTEKNGGIEIKTSSIVTNKGPHTLYAHWRLNNLNIKYKVDGGTLVSQCKNGNSIIANCSGKEFSIINDFLALNGDVVIQTVSAVDKVKFYKLNGNTVSIQSPEGLKISENMEWIDDRGNVYKGDWNTLYSAKEVDPNLKYGDQSFTLNANWEPIKVTIIYNVNGGVLNTASGSPYSTDSDGNILKNQRLDWLTISYDKENFNVHNYNSSDKKGHLNITKSGYTVDSGNEWICSSSNCGIKEISQAQDDAIPARNLCNESHKDCTVTLKVNWRESKVYVNYNVNRGTLNTASGSPYSTDSDGNIKKNGILNWLSKNYGSELNIHNYNSTDKVNYFNITRNEYDVETGKEWKCVDGECSGKVFNQGKYDVKEFCDNDNKDCYVKLKVNWKKIKQPATYTLTYKSYDGNTVYATEKYSENEEYKIKEKPGNNTIANLIGWSEEINGTEIKYKNGSVYTDGNKTIYAITRRKVTAKFNYNKAAWNGEEKTKSCYIYNGNTRCNVKSPSIPNIGKNYKNKKNQKYQDLFQIKGWSTSPNGESWTTPGENVPVYGDVITYYAIVLLKNTSYGSKKDKYYAFPNDEKGLYTRKEDSNGNILTSYRESSMTGMMLTNSSTVYFNRMSSSSWEYIEGHQYPIWIKGYQSDGKCGTSTSWKFNNNPTCGNKNNPLWVPAAWVAW